MCVCLSVILGQYKNVDGENDEEQGLTELGQEQAELAGKRLAEILKVRRLLECMKSLFVS